MLNEPSVRALGFVILEATDLEAWRQLAIDVLGMQVEEVTEERLRLRCDDRAWRVQIDQGAGDRVVALGWEVSSQDSIDQLSDRLRGAGYAVQAGDASLAAERGVLGIASFDDPDGVRLELFYGQAMHPSPFRSPTGARFVTDSGGLGHVAQLVEDPERYHELYRELLGMRLSDRVQDGPFDVWFLHCNSRHHSMAYTAANGLAPVGLDHLMVEVDSVDTVGRAYDKVLRGAAPVVATFGRHTNDRMISFYLRSPSGFEIEYGTGAISIDDEVWLPGQHTSGSMWGHNRDASGS